MRLPAEHVVVDFTVAVPRRSRTRGRRRSGRRARHRHDRPRRATRTASCERSPPAHARRHRRQHERRRDGADASSSTGRGAAPRRRLRGGDRRGPSPRARRTPRAGPRSRSAARSRPRAASDFDTREVLAREGHRRRARGRARSGSWRCARGDVGRRPHGRLRRARRAPRAGRTARRAANAWRAARCARAAWVAARSAGVYSMRDVLGCERASGSSLLLALATACAPRAAGDRPAAGRDDRRLHALLRQDGERLRRLRTSRAAQQFAQRPSPSVSSSSSFAGRRSSRTSPPTGSTSRCRGVTMRPERAAAARSRARSSAWAPWRSRGRDSRRRARPRRRGRRIGVNAGGHLERVARRLFPRAQIVPVADNRTLADQLNGNWVEAIVSDEIEAPVFQRLVPDAVTLGPLHAAIARRTSPAIPRSPTSSTPGFARTRGRRVDRRCAHVGVRARVGRPIRRPRPTCDALLRADRPAAGVHAGRRRREGTRAACRPRTPAQEDAGAAPRAGAHGLRVGLDAERIRCALRGTHPRRARRAGRRARARDDAARPPIDALELESEARPALERISTRDRAARR